MGHQLRSSLCTAAICDILHQSADTDLSACCCILVIVWYAQDEWHAGSFSRIIVAVIVVEQQKSINKTALDDYCYCLGLVQRSQTDSKGHNGHNSTVVCCHDVPTDVQITPIDRVVGQDAKGGETIVDEFLFSFTHTCHMDWMIPGIQPTGRRVSVPFVVVVKFEGDKLLAERIYW